MCGITGWIDWEVDIAEHKVILEEMTSRLSPRGPDAAGFWVSRQAGIGHRRLIVVDPAGGVQPMIRRKGDSLFVLTYNGELYNTDEIRRSLAAKGYVFNSYSDTEVVLVSFLEWGTECVSRFNGIYAFGVWNELERTLFLARDPMGVKPLFYTVRGNTFLFGSELKALLAHPKVKAEIDGEGLSEIFGLGPARTPGRGVFRGICEVRPGSALIYAEGGIKIHKYWSLESRPHPDNFETTVERVRELVEDSIERQLVSDVPVCTLLSGGLDSSIISAVAAGVYRKIGRARLDTYSIDYVDNDRHFQPSYFQPNSDDPWVRKVSAFLETKHHFLQFDTPQLVEALKQAVLARDLPGMADVDSSLFLFCREIKKEATVALSGECADEVFGGYPWFYQEAALNAGTFPWSLSLEARNMILSKELRNRLDLEKYVKQRYEEALLEVPRLAGESPIEERRRELFYLNINWFMALLLDRKDRMSMGSGLEVRVPFCDHRLVEYVWNIPWSFKNYNQREKGILRQAVKGLLPEDVIERKKSPYPKTHNPSYQIAVRKELWNILDDSTSPLLPLIDVTAVREIAGSGGPGLDQPWFGQLMTGAQLMAYLIQIDTWLREYRVSICL
jgi:asparagine synthase (glutamine-hydrolysing)